MEDPDLMVHEMQICAHIEAQARGFESAKHERIHDIAHDIAEAMHYPGNNEMYIMRGVQRLIEACERLDWHLPAEDGSFELPF